jgi:hypothetical protein
MVWGGGVCVLSPEQTAVLYTLLSLSDVLNVASALPLWAEENLQLSRIHLVGRGLTSQSHHRFGKCLQFVC